MEKSTSTAVIFNMITCVVGEVHSHSKARKWQGHIALHLKCHITKGIVLYICFNRSFHILLIDSRFYSIVRCKTPENTCLQTGCYIIDFFSCCRRMEWRKRQRLIRKRRNQVGDGSWLLWAGRAFGVGKGNIYIGCAILWEIHAHPQILAPLLLYRCINNEEKKDVTKGKRV